MRQQLPLAGGKQLHAAGVFWQGHPRRRRHLPLLCCKRPQLHELHSTAAAFSCHRLVISSSRLFQSDVAVRVSCAAAAGEQPQPALPSGQDQQSSDSSSKAKVVPPRITVTSEDDTYSLHATQVRLLGKFLPLEPCALMLLVLLVLQLLCYIACTTLALCHWNSALPSFS
jgi:hypothetical protein